MEDTPDELSVTFEGFISSWCYWAELYGRDKRVWNIPRELQLLLLELIHKQSLQSLNFWLPFTKSSAPGFSNTPAISVPWTCPINACKHWCPPENHLLIGLCWWSAYKRSIYSLLSPISHPRLLASHPLGATQEEEEGQMKLSFLRRCLTLGAYITTSRGKSL